MKALSGMNAEDVLQKDGVGAKVLNSVIYDLSKETYQLCLNLGIDSPKDFRSKQLLMDNFESWFFTNFCVISGWARNGYCVTGYSTCC